MPHPERKPILNVQSMILCRNYDIDFDTPLREAEIRKRLRENARPLLEIKRAAIIDELKLYEKQIVDIVSGNSKLLPKTEEDKVKRIVGELEIGAPRLSWAGTSPEKPMEERREEFLKEAKTINEPGLRVITPNSAA
ncbi:hypothetical protein HY404_00385 [Candidatus Microgenomates bacterium]|nr:hypothetical protein [Candidatus Microgenomates bacterium]